MKKAARFGRFFHPRKRLVFPNRIRYNCHEIKFEGAIPMKQLLCRAEELCPEATATLELMEAEPGVLWLKAQGLL